MRTSLAPIQALVDNTLPDAVTGGLVSVIGGHPSTYSKSPAMWNAAMGELGLEASYLAFDLGSRNAGDLLMLLRETPAWWGGSVTVPHKAAVWDLLDDADPSAHAAGAVNTILRTASGRLVGANTDGAGLVFALLDGEGGPSLLDGLHGAVVLILGGGGAARAAVAALAPLVGTGEVLITNRTPARARELAERASDLGGRGRAVADGDLDAFLPTVDVLVNASVVGQAGIWQRRDGWTMLEAYSPLAPAEAPVRSGASDAAAQVEWRRLAAASIDTNVQNALTRMRRLPPHAVVLDMVYAPAESVLMQHARATDHRAANGRRMLIGQAVEAFVRHVCTRALADAGIDPQSARRTVQRAMTGAFEE